MAWPCLRILAASTSTNEHPDGSRGTNASVRGVVHTDSGVISLNFDINVRCFGAKLINLARKIIKNGDFLLNEALETFVSRTSFEEMALIDRFSRALFRELALVEVFARASFREMALDYRATLPELRQGAVANTPDCAALVRGYREVTPDGVSGDIRSMPHGIPLPIGEGCPSGGVGVE